MRVLTVNMALGFLLAMESSARAQTPEIQNQVKEALAQKEKASQARKEAQEALAKEKEKTQAKEKVAVLEDLLAQALKDNPDIRVAESKLREAEAELNRVRLLVTQKVVAQQRDIAHQKAALEAAEADYRRAAQLHSSGAIAMEAFRNAQLHLEKLKADLARLEADLPYLLGSSGVRALGVTVGSSQFGGQIGRPDQFRGQTGPVGQIGGQLGQLGGQIGQIGQIGGQLGQLGQIGGGQVGQFGMFGSGQGMFGGQPFQEQLRANKSSVPAAMADKIRKALDTTVSVDFSQATPKDVLAFLQQYAKGFNLVEQVRMDKAAPVNLHLKEPVPVGAVFQFLEDQYGWRFVVREYGIVIAEPGRVPPGAVHLQDFWKNRPAQATTSSSSGSSSTSSSTSGQQK